jgi:hypothetical protein
LAFPYQADEEVREEIAMRCLTYEGRNSGSVWKIEDYLNALRLCGQQIGKSPSVKAYDKWRKNRLDRQPSAPRIVQVFGRWSLALQAAGLKPNYGTQPGHSQHFTLEQCYEAVFLCAEDIGRPPAYEEYEAWQRKQPGDHGKGQRMKYPSGTTIRNRIHRKWLEVLKIVFD